MNLKRLILERWLNGLCHTNNRRITTLCQMVLKQTLKTLVLANSKYSAEMAIFDSNLL